MNEAAFALLQKVAQAQVAALHRELHLEEAPLLKHTIEVEIADIRELLLRARLEEEGGPR